MFTQLSQHGQQKLTEAGLKLNRALIFKDTSELKNAQMLAASEFEGRIDFTIRHDRRLGKISLELLELFIYEAIKSKNESQLNDLRAMLISYKEFIEKPSLQLEKLLASIDRCFAGEARSPIAGDIDICVSGSNNRIDYGRLLAG